ncbi:MAG: NAD(+)/NADH kinase [Planctomycetaceae bacterium]
MPTKSKPLPLIILARDPSNRVQMESEQLCQFLRGREGLNVLSVATSDASLLDLRHEAELAVVIGGDGAILRACREFGSHQIPILGVNLGRLGFLADLSPHEFRSSVETIESRDFRVVEHLMFECQHHKEDGTIDTYLGLNETALLSGASLQMIDVRLNINDEHVTTFSGDGLIISTPVGSTAHSLSAGGPILRQDLQAFVVTPICPHTLTVRPVIDDADATYELLVPRSVEGVMLVVDGQIKVPFRTGDRAIIRKAGVRFQLARIPGHSFYGTLHRKLGWTGQPRYRVDG